MQTSAFPLEIYGEVSEHASVGTLSALSLTCRALRSEVEKRLYRTVYIEISSVVLVPHAHNILLLEMFERLMRSPHLLRTVEELRLYDNSFTEERGDQILEIISQSRSYSPFHQMTHLKSLGTNIHKLCSSYVLPSLSSANIQLVSFHYSGWIGLPPVMDGLSAFFRVQTRLEELELSGKLIFGQAVKSIEGLPRNIKALTSTPYALTTSFPRLPPNSLLRLSLHSGGIMPATFPRLDGLEVLRIERPYTTLLQGCQSSFVTLRYLEATTQDCEVVVQHLPSLTALQKLKLQTNHSLSEPHPGWSEEMGDGDVNEKTAQICHVCNLPARSFAACISLQSFEISDFPRTLNHSLTSQIWNRGDKFGTLAIWDVNEWKYS